MHQMLHLDGLQGARDSDGDDECRHEEIVKAWMVKGVVDTAQQKYCSHLGSTEDCQSPHLSSTRAAAPAVPTVTSHTPTRTHSILSSVASTNIRLDLNQRSVHKLSA